MCQQIKERLQVQKKQMVFFFLSATNQQRTRNEKFLMQHTYAVVCITVNIDRISNTLCYEN